MNGTDHEQQFEELLPYYQRLVAFICGFGFNVDRARDLAQDVYVRVYEHRDAYRGEAKWAYLQQTARRLAYNVFRDENAAKRKGMMVSEEALIERPSPRGERPDARLRRKELAQRLDDAIRQLDQNLRICVVYFYVSEMSYQQICEILDISLSALKSRLNTARKQLHAILGEEPPGWRDLDGPEDGT